MKLNGNKLTAPSETSIHPQYAELRKRLLSGLEGNQQDYSDFLTELRISVERYLGSRSVVEHERDDVTQDVLMSVHLARNTYDPSKPFGPWLVSIIRRRLVDRYRVSRRFVAEDIFDHPELEHQAASVEDALFLEKALSSLNPRQRTAIIGTEVYGKTTSEVAAELNMNPGAFRVMLHRALKSLREIVEV
jgi:RNA polymerase sigma-70 factor (ECF subfamily)